MRDGRRWSRLVLLVASTLAVASCDTFGYVQQNDWSTVGGAPTWNSGGLRVEGRYYDWQTYPVRVTIRNVSHSEPITVTVRSKGPKMPKNGQLGVAESGVDLEHATPPSPVTEGSQFAVPAPGQSLFVWLHANVADDSDVAYDFVFATSDGEIVCPMRLDYVRTGP